MPQRSKAGDGFLTRWSRRKLAAARAEAGAEAIAPTAPPSSPPGPTDVPATASPAAAAAPGAGSPALPPVESLSFDSDFTAFLKPGVDPHVQRAALRKLLHDARFNMMDGLDVYIDDYTRPSPLAADVARGLVQARYLFAPPATRVTAEGHVEDVPEDAAASGQAGAADSAVPSVPIPCAQNTAAALAHVRDSDTPVAEPPANARLSASHLAAPQSPDTAAPDEDEYARDRDGDAPPPDGAVRGGAHERS